MQLQQEKSSGISINDVMAIWKQTLQSLESFKQQVQMLKEVQGSVTPTPSACQSPQLPLLDHEVAKSQSLLHSTSQKNFKDFEATRTMKIQLAWQKKTGNQKKLDHSVVSFFNM